MQNLIYYPSFESSNENWLKYSLLYIDNFNPIIPIEGDAYLTDEFRRVQDETDLINIHRPTYEEGNNATIRALEEVEFILKNPYRYNDIFHTANVVREWKNVGQWEYEVFDAKYTYDWKSFCLESGIAQESRNGLLMSKKLALLYMTILAKEVAYYRNASPITDVEELDNYAIFSQTQRPGVDKQIDLAKGIIDLKIPNLNEVSIHRLIDFRNEHRGKLRQFNAELDKFYTGVSNAESPEKFVSNFENVYSELKNQFLSIGVSLTTLTLGAWILINKPDATNPQYLEQVSKGIGFLLTSGLALNNFHKKSKSERYCRKYLAKLGTLR